MKKIMIFAIFSLFIFTNQIKADDNIKITISRTGFSIYDMWITTSITNNNNVPIIISQLDLGNNIEGQRSDHVPTSYIRVIAYGGLFSTKLSLNTIDLPFYSTLEHMNRIIIKPGETFTRHDKLMVTGEAIGLIKSNNTISKIKKIEIKVHLKYYIVHSSQNQYTVVKDFTSNKISVK